VWQLNDCWPVTSWSIADYQLRPKMAFWAIKRESQLITTGLKRTTKGWEAWGVNLSLGNLVVDVQVKVWDARTGSLIYERVLLRDFSLLANCSTEFPEFSLPENTESKVAVAAIYLVQGGMVMARHVNFHEPLKDVPFELSNNLSINISRSGEDIWVELSATVPVKGVLLEVTGENADGVMWGDNGVDLVPGEMTRLPVRGLKPGDVGKLKTRWLGYQLP
jgi:beta-mannosidase